MRCADRENSYDTKHCYLCPWEGLPHTAYSLPFSGTEELRRKLPPPAAADLSNGEPAKLPEFTMKAGAVL